MKQIIVTKKWGTSSKCEVKDFLQEIHHSPEWIGDEVNWTIRSMQVFNNKLGDTYITVLLENANWVAPEVKAMTGNELYESIKDSLDFSIRIAKLSGLNDHFEIWDRFRFSGSSFGLRKGHNVLIFDDSGKSHETIYRSFLSDIGHEPEPKDAVAAAFWSSEESRETRMELAQRPIAIQLGDRSKIAHPVTGFIYENRELILIYNQDVEI